MKLIIGISTMNDGIFSVLDELNPLALKVDIVICQQITNNKDYRVASSNSSITVIQSWEKGLSKSRNAVIDYALEKGYEYLIISDDDVKYNLENLEKLSHYLELNKATHRHYQFKSSDEKGNDRKSYRDKPYELSKVDIFKVSSIEMCLNLINIKKNNLRFDEQFGLGAKYPVGEEAVFLADVLNKNNIIYYIPVNITIHPIESTGSKLFNDPLMVLSRGAMFVRCFGSFKGIIFLLLFWLKKFALRKKNKGDISTFKALKLMMDGYLNARK